MEKGPTIFKKSLKARTLKKVIPKNRYNKALFHVFLISIASSEETYEIFWGKKSQFSSQNLALYVNNLNL